MSVDKVFLFVCTRVVSRTCDLQHVGAEGLWGADISEVSKITTSSCMKRTLTPVPQQSLGLCLAFVFEAYSAHFRELNSSSTLRNIFHVFFSLISTVAQKTNEKSNVEMLFTWVWLVLAEWLNMSLRKAVWFFSLAEGGGWRKTRTMRDMVLFSWCRLSY